MERKSILLDLLTQSHEHVVAFVEGLPPEARDREGGPDGWSAKDLVAHIAVWNRRRAEDLRAVRNGEAPREPEEDFDHENAAIFEAHRALSWEEVLGLAEEATAGFQAEVAELSEEDLERLDYLFRDGESPLWRSIVGTGYNHPLVHLSEFYQSQGDRRRAGDLIGELARSTEPLDDAPVWKGVVRYNLACMHALKGENEAAVGELARALALNPALTEWSQQDPDLDGIRGEPAYAAIYAAGEAE